MTGRLSHQVCLLIIGICHARCRLTKNDLQILYLTGLGLPVGINVPAHLMVDWDIRSLHLVAIELKSSVGLYRLVIFSNCLPFCTCQNVANFIRYLEFLPDHFAKTIWYKISLSDYSTLILTLFWRSFFAFVSATHFVRWAAI